VPNVKTPSPLWRLSPIQIEEVGENFGAFFVHNIDVRTLGNDRDIAVSTASDGDLSEMLAISSIAKIF
jgi:hypothetical protein